MRAARALMQEETFVLLSAIHVAGFKAGSPKYGIPGLFRSAKITIYPRTG
jgi:hypothetical protein